MGKRENGVVFTFWRKFQMCKEMEIKNFTDVSAAVDFLFFEGWKITKSSFYRHRVEGKIRCQADGTYTLAAVQKYAKTFLKRRPTTTLLREALERELTKRTVVFRNELETFCRIRAAEIVTLVAGDPGKVSDLIEYLLDHAEDCIERYAEKREYVAPPPALDGTEDEKQLEIHFDIH